MGRSTKSLEYFDADGSGRSDKPAVLIGTEEQLFARALEGLPPAAEPHVVEVLELAKQHHNKSSLPTTKMLQAIEKVLDLSRRLGPSVDPAPLLLPLIRAAKARLAHEALLPKVKRIKRLLPDTSLRAALLDMDPAEVSKKITRIVAAFLSELSMQPPVELLVRPITFARALQLPEARLRAHLQLLKQAVPSVAHAQQLAQRYMGALVARNADRLLLNVREVSQLLSLSQEGAVELLLRHPSLAGTEQQLSHLSHLLSQAPAALGVVRQVLVGAVARRPELVRYAGADALAVKFKVMSANFPDASADQLLELCSYRGVRQAVTPDSLSASLRTSAAIMGYTSLAPLLPLLLHPPQPHTPRERPYTAGTGRRRYAMLFQPAEELAKRAGHVQRLLGLTREQLQQLARQLPNVVLKSDASTRQLKLVLLQMQMLGDGQLDEGDQLAPEFVKMLKKCPQITWLSLSTITERLGELERGLQLQKNQGAQLALRWPQVLVYNTDRMAACIQHLVAVTGSLDTARKLVLKNPQVLQFSAKLQANEELPILSKISVLLAAPCHQHPQQLALQQGKPCVQQPQPQPQPLQQTQAALAVEQAVQGSQAEQLKLRDSPVYAAAMAAVQSAADRVAAARKAGGLPLDQKFRGADWHKGSNKWRMRHGRYKLTLYFKSALEAACAYDLVLLATARMPSSRSQRTLQANFPSLTYAAEEIEAMAGFMQARLAGQPRLEHPDQQEQQQQQEEQPEQLIAQMLSTQAGLHLLGLTPEASMVRLHTLADLTGRSVRDLLSTGLNQDSYLKGVLKLSPARMEAQALMLQQELALSHEQLQKLLRAQPSLLQMMPATLAVKVETLVPAFDKAWTLAAAAAAAADSSITDQMQPQRREETREQDACGVRDGEERVQQLQLPQLGDAEAALQDGSVTFGSDNIQAGMLCLQRAALSAPLLLWMTPARIAQRLQVLQDVFGTEALLVHKLRHALETGSIGRWLLSGDAHYVRLQELSAGCSPQLHRVSLSDRLRLSESSKPAEDGCPGTSNQ